MITNTLHSLAVKVTCPRRIHNLIYITSCTFDLMLYRNLCYNTPLHKDAPMCMKCVKTIWEENYQSKSVDVILRRGISLLLLPRHGIHALTWQDDYPKYLSLFDSWGNAIIAVRSGELTNLYYSMDVTLNVCTEWPFMVSNSRVWKQYSTPCLHALCLTSSMDK